MAETRSRPPPIALSCSRQRHQMADCFGCCTHDCLADWRWCSLVWFPSSSPWGTVKPNGAETRGVCHVFFHLLPLFLKKVGNFRGKIQVLFRLCHFQADNHLFPFGSAKPTQPYLIAPHLTTDQPHSLQPKSSKPASFTCLFLCVRKFRPPHLPRSPLSLSSDRLAVHIAACSQSLPSTVSRRLRRVSPSA